MRSILKIVLVVLLVVIGVTAYFWSSRASTVSNIMTELMGVDVSIRDIQVGLNGVSVHGIQIGAPSGSKIDHSFKTDLIEVKMNVKDLFADPMAIEDIYVPNPSIGVELYDKAGKDNNWTRIINNVTGGEEAAPAEEPAEAEEGKQVLVKHVLVTDMEVVIAGSPLSADPMTVKPDEDLELHDVGGGKPMPIDQITALIIRALMKHMTMIDGLKNLTQGILEEGFKVIETPLKGVEQLIPGSSAPTEGGTEGGGVGETLKGLFK